MRNGNEGCVLQHNLNGITTNVLAVTKFQQVQNLPTDATNNFASGFVSDN